jgi:hypothetical protein
MSSGQQQGGRGAQADETPRCAVVFPRFYGSPLIVGFAFHGPTTFKEIDTAAYTSTPKCTESYVEIKQCLRPLTMLPRSRVSPYEENRTWTYAAAQWNKQLANSKGDPSRPEG